MKNVSYIIVFTGIAGLLALLLMAMFSMGQVTTTPAGERTRIALLVKEKFGYTSVQVDPSSQDLYFVVERKHATEEPPVDDAREAAAKKLLADSKRFLSEYRNAEAQKAYDKLREYTDTEAYGTVEMRDVADFAVASYNAEDRNKIETIRIVRRILWAGSEPREQTLDRKVEKKPVPVRGANPPGPNPEPGRELKRK